MQKIIYFLIFFLFTSAISAQKYSVHAGLNAFAPIPTAIDSNAKGSIYPYFYTGISAKYTFLPHFSAQIGLNYNRKSAGYEAPLPQAETTVLVTLFGGQQQLVNASYRGDVKGRMNLHYLDIPLLLSYDVGRWNFQLGTYYSRPIAGQDTGTVHIIIGNPGVEFSRDTSTFNNFGDIRKNTFGLMAGINYEFPMGIVIETRIMRSFQALYTQDFMQKNPENNQALYMTGLQFGVAYRFLQVKD